MEEQLQTEITGEIEKDPRVQAFVEEFRALINRHLEKFL